VLECYGFLAKVDSVYDLCTCDVIRFTHLVPSVTHYEPIFMTFSVTCPGSRTSSRLKVGRDEVCVVERDEVCEPGHVPAQC